MPENTHATLPADPASPPRQGPPAPPATNSLFEEPWWLDAVAPGGWGAVTVKHGDATVARLPYVLRRRRGLTALVQPPLSQTLGPWVDGGEASEGSHRTEDLLAELLDRLPQAGIHVQQLAPSADNALPFLSRGYTASPRYTYRLEDLSDLDRIWQGFKSGARSEVRRARKRYEVRTDLELDTLLGLAGDTFRRQGVDSGSTFTEQLVRRIDAALREHAGRRLLVAVDAEGEPQAALYLVWDARCAYLLMAGQPVDSRSGGAPSLLVWEAIQHAASVSEVFDFEGSMIPAVERFYRGFGGRQTQYLSVRRVTRWLEPLVAVRKSLRRGGSRLWALLAAGASGSQAPELLLIVTI